MNEVVFSGTARPEFDRVARAFARVFGTRPGAGAGLAVFRHGEPLVDIWTGHGAPDQPWEHDTATVVFSATKGAASTVIHRLADRDLLDYAAPVAEYWPEFAAGGKGDITIRQVLTHSAGLSGIDRLTKNPADLLDCQQMEHRVAAARPDGTRGGPAYHAMTYGWLLSGLARSLTGLGMKELIEQEINEVLGGDPFCLGRLPSDSALSLAVGAGTHFREAGGIPGRWLLGHLGHVPGALGTAVRSLFIPGAEQILAGAQPSLLDAEMASASGVCTARSLATLYSPLACDGMYRGRQYLSEKTMRAVRRIEQYRPDSGLFFYLPPLWHLGYHSLPVIGARRGFGHMGLGGSFGWADPTTGVSVGFVHNRLSFDKLAWDMASGLWLLPLIMVAVQSGRHLVVAREPDDAAA